MAARRTCPARRAPAPPPALARFALAAALSAPLALAAQERPPPATRATITGTVVNAVTRQPIDGVTVQISYMGYRIETDAEGRFTLRAIPVGNYRLSLSHPGYHPAVGDFAIMRSGEFEAAMDPVGENIDELMTGIVGVVSDERGGGAIAGAGVRVGGGGQGTRTDVRGAFALDDLAPGANVVEFSQIGYATRTETIEVLPGRVTNVRLSLSADPLLLDPIVVTVERREVALQSAGFYDRLDQGFGEFVDRAEIESRGPAEMTDIFSRVPGVELFADPDNPIERYVVLRGGRQSSFSAGPYGRCFPRVVLDGQVISSGGDEPAALDRMLDPAAIAGVEVFSTASGVPVQYGGVGSSCGVILIWTRR